MMGVWKGRKKKEELCAAQRQAGRQAGKRFDLCWLTSAYQWSLVRWQQICSSGMQGSPRPKVKIVAAADGAGRAALARGFADAL